MTTLRIYNKQLSGMLTRLKNRFLTEEPPSDKHDRAFFDLVKRETEPMYELLQNGITLQQILSSSAM